MEKPLRSRAEIDSEYSNVCMQAGDMMAKAQFKLQALLNEAAALPIEEAPAPVSDDAAPAAEEAPIADAPVAEEIPAAVQEAPAAE